MSDMEITVNEYFDNNGNFPYERWLSLLKDVKGKAAIISRVDRMELGNFGDSEPVGDGISTLGIHIGPGYRVYYARDAKTELPPNLRTHHKER